MKFLILAAMAARSLFGGDLPDARLTPGTTVDVPLAKLCKKGYAKSVRHVPGSAKSKVYAEYGVKSHKSGSYEVDHLISLELGGSNDLKNLWPQSYSGEWNAHVKDALEDRLHALVCAEDLTLEDAQGMIRKDWISAYRKIFKAKTPVE